MDHTGFFPDTFQALSQYKGVFMHLHKMVFLKLLIILTLLTLCFDMNILFEKISNRLSSQSKCEINFHIDLKAVGKSHKISDAK
jgi:hypothetical protein